MEKNLNFLESYTRPYLVADHINSEPGNNYIHLHGRGRTLKIDVNGDHKAATDFLRRLKDPTDEIWRSVHFPNQTELQQTLEVLDQYGWIEDSANEGKDALEKANERFLAIIKEAVDWISGGLKEGGFSRQNSQNITAFRILLRSFYSDSTVLVKDIMNTKRSGETLLSLPNIGNDTVASKALMLMLRAWQRSSPAALWAFTQALELSIKTFFDESEEFLPIEGEFFTLSGLENIDEIRNQVWSACCLLAQALDTTKLPIWKNSIPSGFDSDSGINTVIQAEAAAEVLINSIGIPDLLNVINTGKKDKVERCAAGVFLHQYFVTIRYLEAILSFLRYRMNDKLRKVGFDYLLEEVGHDVHEREACLKLGLSDEDIARFAPLPLFNAYVDILVYFAEVKPISFCLMVVVGEGLPGQKKVIADALASQGVDDPGLAVHTDLDLTLNHSYYPRKMMRTIPWIDGKERREAMQHFLFLLELSQLAWAQLSNYAANGDLQTVHSAFHVPFNQVYNNYNP